VQAIGRHPQRVPDGAPVHYERHRPEQSTLYRLVQQHAASFIAHTEASTGGELPRFFKEEFDAFLACGILAHGFLRLRCGECGHDKLPAAQPELVTPVLQVVQRLVTSHLLDRAGLKADEGQGGAVTLIQRFGSAAKLNVHLHGLVLDGVYRCDADGVPAFVEAQAPTDDELHALLQTVITRLMKMLMRRGALVDLKLKTPWRDGTTQLVMTPLVFMQRLAALVPRPSLHLIRFHGVLAPNAKLRPRVVPQGPEVQERATEVAVADECEVETVQARPHRISWARLLKRVFDIDMQHCPNCGAGELKIIAAILRGGPGSAATTPRADVRGGARFCSLSHARNHAGRLKHHAPGLQRETAAGAATRDASARHHRSQGQP
jgi:ribosomal protein S27AE